MQREDRSMRILESAAELAEQGGFEAVRLRDVASHAGVALGTLYRRFGSKEALLIATLERETEELEERVFQKLPKAETEEERLVALYATITRNLCRKPNLARAMLRALVTGSADLSEQVQHFHARLARITVATLLGEVPKSEADVPATERKLAWHLDMVWFALIIGWSSGVHSQADVIDEMGDAIRLALAGSRLMSAS